MSKLILCENNFIVHIIKVNRLQKMIFFHTCKSSELLSKIKYKSYFIKLLETV